MTTQNSHAAKSYSQRHFSKTTARNQDVKRGEPDLLYYDSPEEYENHQQVTLQQSLKDQWRARYEQAIRRLSNPGSVQAKTPDSHVLVLSAHPPIQTQTNPIAPVATTIVTTKIPRPPSPDYPPPGYVATL